MPKRLLAARLDFYRPDGTLRVQLSDDVRRIQIKEVARDEADDAGFDIANHNAAHTAAFTIGDEVRVYVQTEDDGALVHTWTGVVDGFGSKRAGLTFADLPVKAQDYVYWRLSGRSYVTDAFEDIEAGALVRLLLQTYFPGIGTSYVETVGVTIPSIRFNGVSGLAAIRQIAELAGCEFRGDKDKNLHFFVKKTQSSGLSVGPADVVRGSFNIETSMAGFGNVQKVRGGSRSLVDATNGEAFASWGTVDNAGTRQKIKVRATKSRFTKVELWTDPNYDILSNGSFESGTTDWSVLSGSPSVVTLGGAPDGSKVAYFAAGSDAYWGATFKPAVAGHRYKLSFKAKGSGIVAGANPWNDLRVGINAFDSSFNYLGFMDVSAGVGTFDWTEFSGVYTAPANTAYLRIALLGMNAASAGQGWIDVVKLVDLDSLGGDLRLRVQVSNAAGTAPIDENDDTRDIVNRTLSQEFLAHGDWTTFILGEHTLPPGGDVWLIVDSPSGTQRAGLDTTGPDLMYRTYYPVPIIIERTDATSIATYGRRELPPINDKSISTEDEATLLADVKLAMGATPARQGGYTLSNMALVAASVGTTISASFPDDGVSAATALIIMEKTHDYDADRGTYVLRHAVADAERVRRLEDILLGMEERIQRVSDSVFGSSVDSIIDAIRVIATSAKAADAITATERTGGYQVGSAQVGFSVVG